VSEMLSCVILCGGLATRLRPVTEKVPKSLIRISGEPFIAHQLRLLHSHHVDRVVLCVGYLGEAIQEFVGDGSAFGVTISYSFDGASLLGTAGAIRRALPLLDSSFFVLYGDSYLPCDYESVWSTFEASGKPGLMTIYRNEDNYDSSNVEAADGLILKYDKRERTPSMRYIDYGLGVFKKSVFEELPADQVRDLAGVYQELLMAGDLASYEVQDRFYEIGSLDGIQDLEQRIATEKRVSPETAIAKVNI
jgi:NDP-sugar pyrophosphorylase family protein